MQYIRNTSHLQYRTYPESVNNPKPKSLGHDLVTGALAMKSHDKLDYQIICMKNTSFSTYIVLFHSSAQLIIQNVNKPIMPVTAILRI